MHSTFNENARIVGRESVSLGLALRHSEYVGIQGAKGVFTLELRDARTGALIESWVRPNILTRDCGILAARLFKDSQAPVAGRHNGVTMLAVGTGATGALLAPDPPQDTQRRLNTEICRKPFASTTFRDANGEAVSIPTNVVDFVTTFGQAEAVGPLNEMGLIASFSPNPSVRNQVLNGPTGYDPTIDVSEKDLLMNYLTFPVCSKPAGAILSLGYRITF